MAKRTQGTKSRQKTPAPENLRPQRDVREQWRLESAIKHCRAQIALWQKNLAGAQEGRTRWTAQIAAGHGYAHSVLAGFIKEIGEAEGMLAAFAMEAVKLQAQIDALMPNAAKVAERAEGQRVLAAQIRASLELVRKLDFTLEYARRILTEKAELVSKMRDGARALGFSDSLNLDDERFDRLLRALPEKMAAESEKFVKWFLGEDGERKPYTVVNDEVVLDETLRSCNAFRRDECPSLTKEEIARIEAIGAPRGPSVPEVETETRRPGEAAPEVSASKIQWALLR